MQWDGGCILKSFVLISILFYRVLSNFTASARRRENQKLLFFWNGRRVVLFGAEKLDEKFRLDKTDSIYGKDIFFGKRARFC